MADKSFVLTAEQRLARARLAQKASKAMAAYETGLSAEGKKVLAGYRAVLREAKGIGTRRAYSVAMGKSPLTKDDLELLLDALNAESDARKAPAK